MSQYVVYRQVNAHVVCCLWQSMSIDYFAGCSYIVIRDKYRVARTSNEIMYGAGFALSNCYTYYIINNTYKKMAMKV